MDSFQLDPIYPITASTAGGAGHLELARQFLDGGVRLLQVREKKAPDARLLDELIEINRLCRARGARMIVNDRVDLALASGAAGVHLGQEDLPVAAARAIAGNRLILGLSTHSADEFLAAQQLDVDYVALGPVYASSTKTDARAPLGLELVRSLMPHKRHPVVAIGGIDPDRARRLWESGVDSVAVIHDIISAPDPTERIIEYLRVSQG